MEYQPKLNKKHMPFLHSISSFEGNYLLKLYIKDTVTSSFIYCCFILSFTLADIVFYKFLEFHSPLFEKRFLTQILLI